VYLVGDDRLELLAIVDIRRDPAWIEGTIAEDAQRPRERVCAGQEAVARIVRQPL
jgi:hypothetical protein